MKKYNNITKLPLIFLLTSLLCLILTIVTLFIGAPTSKLYYQMKRSEIIDNIAGILNSDKKPFLLSGHIDIKHKTLENNLVTYQFKQEDDIINVQNPTLEIVTKGGKVILEKGYGLADFNEVVKQPSRELFGIKTNSDITIYAISSKVKDSIRLTGYELYPGTPNQYIKFLSSPFNSYMVYVRIFIGLSLLFFLLSIVLNIKK